ncbi:MAG: DUF1295 domain-containing protein [Deltaproteobacteria bacterium]|nr:DUF1295 domain-containing protein [Deltaproteobacteria bacterium]
MFGGFVAVLFVASALLPGSRQQGAELADGTRLTYKLNGFLIFLLTVAGVAIATWRFGFSLAPVARHFWPLFVVVNLFAFALTGILYLTGRRQAEGLWRGLFFGAKLNPNWLGVDLKMFSYRPSLIGLMVLNVSFAYLQFEVHGQLSQPMLLFQVFFLLYIGNYFQYEYGMLFTWDVIAERFGWMLIWGDYVLVPFFYSIAGWTLLDRTEPLPTPALFALPAMYLLGFWLFRGANEQKHRYKRDPQARIWGRPAQTIGGRLLVSGFWGVGRHLNYTGEILMYLSWTLTTGFEQPWPYILPTWLISLLVHRAWRDDRRCRAKYGELWDAYCKRAKFRMIPFIY